jgi:hypothetical protein
MGLSSTQPLDLRDKLPDYHHSGTALALTYALTGSDGGPM